MSLCNTTRRQPSAWSLTGCFHPDTEWTEPQWLDLTGKFQHTTPLQWETNLKFWQVLHETVYTEPVFACYHTHYGELAALGIQKGTPFEPDDRTRSLLETAAHVGNGQMRVQAFADRSPDRMAWNNRQWEWVALRYADGDFNTATHVDLTAREKWFYQAIGASPAMFRRDTRAGSLYWLGFRDASGASLDGGRHYELTVPLPVPGKLFWSVTVYDAETRSQIQTDQNKAALRSLFELTDLSGDAAQLFFGPTPPEQAAIRRLLASRRFGTCCDRSMTSCAKCEEGVTGCRDPRQETSKTSASTLS